MNDLLSRTFYHNTLQHYLVATGIILIGIVLIRLFKRTILKRVKAWTGQTNTHVDDYIIAGIERFGLPALYLAVVYIGLSSLNLPPRGEEAIRVAATIVVIVLVVRLLSSVIHVLLEHYVRRQDRGDEKVKQLGGIMLIVNIVFWATGLLFLFDNMGYDVTTVVAGLGIGGIAIALAAQNILGDLFNYFVIFFDRPFEVGDFIEIEGKSGTVDYIGIKTTRLQSLTGEQLVIANSDLTTSRIHNFKRMAKRRVAFTVGVIYQTPVEQLEQIPALLKAIVEEQRNVLFDRAHFASFKESSLDFEVVYHILSSDYTTFMDIQQQVNLGMLRSFQQQGIEFAYPTRTVFVNKEEGSNTVPPQVNRVA